MPQRAAPPLPTRDGVGPSCVSLPAGRFETIAQCLIERFPSVEPAEWRARMAAGDVVDEHGGAVTAERAHLAGLRVYYYRTIAAEARVPFDEKVLFRDAHIVVADKPHFLSVTPSGRHLKETLLVRLKLSLGIDTLAPVHRIDRETAGLVLFSIDPETRGRYHRLFADRQVRKGYECIAPWRAGLPPEYASRLEDDPQHFMRMREVPGAPNAHTRFELIERREQVAHYALFPATGKRHQLRVHCAALGMPIVSDRIYPVLMPADTDDHANPLRLLARSLAFVDPVTGTERRFESAFRLSWPNHQYPARS
jgi:tRNA pseudouridine32 synthase/23S rRNA pseudouridine746 synthase